MILTKAVIDYYHQNPESSITNAKLCLYSEDDATMFMQAPKLHESLVASSCRRRVLNQKFSQARSQCQ